MISGVLFWLAVGGLVLTATTAVGVKVLHEFSRSELEVYCRRRRNRELFGVILDHHEQVALAVESLQIVAVSITAPAGVLWIASRGAEITLQTLFAATLVAALALLVATVWTPWAIVRVWSAPFLYHTWPIWRICGWLLSPLTIGAGLADELIRRLANRPEEDDDEEQALEDEIRTIVTEGHRDGLLEGEEREMIEGVIKLDDLDVSDIMTERSNVDALDISLPWEKKLQFIISCGRTRIPVYEESLDNTLGVLYVKDLLRELARGGDFARKRFRTILREAWFVPKRRPLDELLQDFLKTRNHLAIVIDEYHAVEGVVTIEDVLEEIVGEIVDESDKEEVDGVTEIDDTTAEALGRVHLDDLNEKLSIDLPEQEDYDTVGGFIVAALGRIPKVGEAVVWRNIRLTVLEANRRRVERVKVEQVETPHRETVEPN